MIECLLWFGIEKDERENHSLNMTTYHSLIRRGMLRHVMNKGFYLTEAGSKMIELLLIAGYSIEKEITNPPRWYEESELEIFRLEGVEKQRLWEERKKLNAR